jgi:nitrite reductase (NADH) large subunit
MFYVNTADPLTRTATWLNKMEGGMSYLKNVIVNDSLGIAHELEAAMRNHVNTYMCEWKAAIENPEMRKRFNHFVNAPREKDPTAQFEKMREQVKAREW